MGKVFTFSGSVIKEFKSRVLLECGIDFSEPNLLEDSIVIGFDSKELDPKTVWNSVLPEYHHMIFTKNELNFNIAENSMVSEHSVEDPSDHPDKDRYPTILSYDPMVRKISAKLGDVIKIESYYRVVRF